MSGLKQARAFEQQNLDIVADIRAMDRQLRPTEPDQSDAVGAVSTRSGTAAHAAVAEPPQSQRRTGCKMRSRNDTSISNRCNSNRLHGNWRKAGKSCSARFLAGMLTWHPS